MDFSCIHYVSAPSDQVGRHTQCLTVPADQSALLLVNVYGWLLPSAHPARQALVDIYGEKEVIHREDLVRNALLPVLEAARQSSMPVIYVADSAPNIGLDGTHIRELMVRHLNIDPITRFAEDCNDPREYRQSSAERMAYSPELAPQEGDFYIRKWVHSGFYATWLDRLLRNLNSEVLFCAGFNGDSDLLCTMLEGHWAGYRMVLVRDCHAAVHVPAAEPEMGFTQRMEMYAEGNLGFTITPEDFCTACGFSLAPLTPKAESAHGQRPLIQKPDNAITALITPEKPLPAVDAIPQSQSTSDASCLSLSTRYFRRYPADAMLGYTEETVALDAARTAFLAVDVYGETPTPMLVERIAPAMQAAREAGLPVIYLGNSAPRVNLDHYEFTIQRDRNAKHYFPRVSAELPVDPREYHHGDGPWGRYQDCVAPQPGDMFIRKIAYSGFYETRLDSALRHLGIENLIGVGFSASECLLGTLIEAFNRNYRVVLLRDCTRGGARTELERQTDSFTQRMILWMETYIGVSATSRDFITACDRLR